MNEFEKVEKFYHHMLIEIACGFNKELAAIAKEQNLIFVSECWYENWVEELYEEFSRFFSLN